MGEHKTNPRAIAAAQPAAVLTDLDEAGKILAGETIWCDMCGESFPLWPPDELYFHTHKEHAHTFWPQPLSLFKNYLDDTDLARRQNFINQYRVTFFFLVLERRCDLYTKLVEAGVIKPPRQG